MELFTAFLVIIRVFAVSLGVGASTLAILNFFAAIADGSIDETERRMMGIVYVVLRVAMVAILFSTLLLYALSGYSPLELLGFSYAYLTVIAVLYINAILMTKHLIPNTVGPALQAGSWYMLGLMNALMVLEYVYLPFWLYLLGYVVVFFLAVSVVNATMAWMKGKRAAQAS